MKRIIRLWAVAAVMAAMLAMSASASLAQQQLPTESCTGIATAQENSQTPPGLEKPPPGVPFTALVKCEV
jgi:uncharacterized membrane protein